MTIFLTLLTLTFSAALGYITYKKAPQSRFLIFLFLIFSVINVFFQKNVYINSSITILVGITITATMTFLVLVLAKTQPHKKTKIIIFSIITIALYAMYALIYMNIIPLLLGLA